MISIEDSSQSKYLKEIPMEHRPINKTSESLPTWILSPETVAETTEFVPDVGAYYTIEVVPDVDDCYTINELGDFVVYSNFDIASDDDIDRVSTDSADISGYEGDYDFEQSDVSGNGTDSDVESRIALAKKARLVLQKASGVVESISGMPLESLFETVEDFDSDDFYVNDLTSLGSSYTDELVSDNEDEGLASGKDHFDTIDQQNEEESLTPKKLLAVKGRKKTKPVKRKLRI